MSTGTSGRPAAARRETSSHASFPQPHPDAFVHPFRPGRHRDRRDTANQGPEAPRVGLVRPRELDRRPHVLRRRLDRPGPDHRRGASLSAGADAGAGDAATPGETYGVLVVGPAGRERASVEAMLSSAGHRITGASFDEAAALAAAADYDLALVVDRRTPGPRTWSPAGLPAGARLPVLLLAGQPTRLLSALAPSEAELRRSGRPEMGAWLTPLPSLSDETLAQLARAGSLPAFEMLHERYAPS